MSYLTNTWVPVTDPSWVEFREQCWGNSDLINTKVIHLGNSTAAQELSPGSCLWGPALDALYIRPELTGLFKRIEQLFDNQKANGVILTGQPGCGKTVSLLFFLLCQLAMRRPVLFTKALTTTYFFCDIGIWRAELSQLESDDIPAPGGPVWSLIDSDRAREEPPDPILRCCFPIHAVSPNDGRYNGWRKQIMPRMLVLNPWNIEDLMGWAEIEPLLRTPPMTYNDLQQLVDLCGPIPRDILAERTGLSTIQQVSTALNKLSPEDFRKQLGSSAETFHELICVWGHVNGFYEDSFTTDFKSLHVAQCVYDKWRLLKEEEALRFYQLCRGNAENSFLAGWVFESIAVRYMSGMTHLSVFYPLCTMAASSNTTYTDSNTIQPTDRDVLYVTEEGAVLRRNDGSIIFRHTPAAGVLVKKRRDILSYGDISNVALNDNMFYVPVVRNNPLFDAFFLEVDGTNVIAWILQITASKRHQGPASGYDLIKSLKTRLAVRYPAFAIHLRYVLVVPLLRCAVSWHLPQGWTDDVSGHVYVQYMDMAQVPNP